MDMPLNNLQWLKCHKTKPNQTPRAKHTPPDVKILSYKTPSDKNTDEKNEVPLDKNCR